MLLCRYFSFFLPMPNKKSKKHYRVRVCTSQKSCGSGYAPFIWERLCNEHGINPELESFESHGVQYQKSQCQGFCKKSSNVQITDGTSPVAQFHYMTPLKSVSLMKSLQKGVSPANIKRL